MAAPAQRRTSRASTPPPRQRGVFEATGAAPDVGDVLNSQLILVVPDAAPSRGLLSKVCSVLACILLAICAFWVCCTAFQTYRVMYPPFVHVDPTTGKTIPSYANIFAIGDECRAEISVGSRKWEFNFTYSDAGFVPRSHRFEVNIPAENATMGYSEYLEATIFHERGYRFSKREKLVKQVKRPVETPEYWLLRSEACPVEEELALHQGTSHVIRGVPKMEVQLLFDTTLYPKPFRNSTFLPTLYVNAVQMLDEELVTLNSTDMNVFDSEVTFRFMSIERWRFNQRMALSFKQKLNVALLGDDEDDESVKMLLDLFANTNSYLLAATFISCFLHMFFEFLALKNDIAFFQNCDAASLNKFVSIQSIVVEIFTHVVLLLYLWDEGANVLLIMSSAISIVVDMWKVQRAMRPSWRIVWGFLPVPFLAPRVEVRSVQNYDSMAMKLLGLALTPLVLGYGFYTLVFDCHRGWYSYCLKFSASCVYSGGFVLMFPQVFMNYKHKTVAYLPWRKFCYRAVSTFIDDLFAFVIKMPNMHRLSCFRDDVVFIIYLYQRWIYAVDTSRPFDETDFEADTENRNPLIAANGVGRTPNSKKCQ